MKINQNNVEETQNFKGNKSNAQTVYKNENKNKKKLIIFIGVIIAIILIVNLSTNMLWGDDKIAYDLIVEASKEFKDPSSVRLIFGVLYSGKESGAFDLSAKNSWGARGVGNYEIGNSDDGEVYILNVEDDLAAHVAYNFAKRVADDGTIDVLNVDKINKALERKWR